MTAIYAKVLLVDDNRMLLKSLAHTVEWESVGCRVCAMAGNALEALAQISLEPPDVIISDIKMPKMSGLDFAAQVKSMLPSCIIIFLTGYQYFEYAQAALRMGASDFLIKPVRNADLIKSLKRALQGRHFDDAEESDAVLPANPIDRIRKIAIDIIRLLGSYQPEMIQQYTDIIASLETMDNKAQITDSMETALKDFRSQVTKAGYHPVVEKLLEYIRVGYHDDMKLTSVAEQFNISQGYLCRLIKAETGKSFTELLLEKRIEKAKALLRNSDMRATDIAFEVGYRDYAYFYLVFKRLEGMTPNEYKKSYMNVK